MSLSPIIKCSTHGTWFPKAQGCTICAQHAKALKLGQQSAERRASNPVAEAFFPHMLAVTALAMMVACGAEPNYGRAYSAKAEVAAFVAEAVDTYPQAADVLAGIEVRIGDEPIAGGELGGVYDAGDHEVRVLATHSCASIQHELAHALLHGLEQYDVLHTTPGVWSGADSLVARAQRAAGCR